MSEIIVPELVRSGDVTCVVSMSGGKDSTATSLALREAGVAARYVFADTGWEAPETYAHLDELRKHFGHIEVVGVDGGMVAKIRARAGFPARMQRWCTRELKIKPLRAFHDALIEGGADTVCVVGVRGQESAARARMLPWEDDDQWGGWTWRPLIAWTIEDVLAIHHRHGVPVNTLYLRGHDRVGCYPCIFSRKEEVALIAKHAPERIDQIRELEAETTAMRAVRNAETPGRYAHMNGTFFQGRSTRYGFTPIDTVVEWSRTSHGGRQLPLFSEPPSGGCFRWGMCEPPSNEESGESATDSEVPK